jgi:hypothetical protein
VSTLLEDPFNEPRKFGCAEQLKGKVVSAKLEIIVIFLSFFFFLKLEQLAPAI